MALKIEAELLPAELVRAIEFNLGRDEAQEWLLKASESANRHAAIWDISFDRVLTGGALSLCMAGTNTDGLPVVMKVPADVSAGRREIAALRSWGGIGCPAIMAEDEETSVFLMEYLAQTTDPVDPDDVYRLARDLHRLPHKSGFAFPTIEENVAMRVQWAEERFGVNEYAHLQPDLETAKTLCRLLLTSGGEKVLLHGDFQRKNLLMTAEGLRALDPHACVGDPIFDAAFWVALAHHDHSLSSLLSRYPAEQDSVEFHRFVCWTWAISVIENRPYQALGATARQEFISDFRTVALEHARCL